MARLEGRSGLWIGITTLAASVVLLEIAVRMNLVNAVLIPPPTLVIQHASTILGSGAFAAPLGQTLYLLAMGYAIGCVLAIALGLAMGRVPLVDGLLEPLVEVFRPLPKPALLPPLILFLGLGDPMKLVVISLGVFFPVLVNTIQGVRGTDPVLLDVARTFQHSGSALIWKVVFPAAMPLILTGMRISLGIGLVLVVVAEMMAGTGGIGYLIVDMQRSFRIPDMYAWSLILAVLGLGLNEIFEWIEHRLIHWSGTRQD